MSLNKNFKMSNFKDNSLFKEYIQSKEIMDITNSEDDCSNSTLNTSLIKQIDKISKKCHFNDEIHIEIPIKATKVLHLRRSGRKSKFYKDNKSLNNSKLVKLFRNTSGRGTKEIYQNFRQND